MSAQTKRQNDPGRADGVSEGIVAAPEQGGEGGGGGLLPQTVGPCHSLMTPLTVCPVEVWTETYLRSLLLSNDVNKTT